MSTAQTRISEEELIELLKNDKEAGFNQLYANYSAVLYGISRKIVGSEEIAQDVLQDSFVKIWKNFSKYDSSKGRLFTWLLNITRNTAIDYTRSKEFQTRSKFSTEFKLESHSNASEMNVDAIGMSEMLNLLDPESKLVLETVYMKGYTHVEAAEYLNLPLGTIKTRIRNGMMILRNNK